jgi:hypothetical protein
MPATARFVIVSDIQDAIDDLKRLDSQFGIMEKANKDANGALKTFGIDLDALSNPITLVAQGMKAAIDETVKWAGDIDKLSRNTGLSTEEASKLAIVAGDVGIEMGTLERALKKMNKEGLELNIDTLKKVSKEYNATNDPVERLKIATKNFGAAAQDMTEILSRSPEELDALANAAERSGRVMSEEAVAAAEEYEQTLAQLQDTMKGMQVTVGTKVIPVLTDAAQAFGNINLGLQAMVVQAMLATGAIDQNQAALRLEAAAAGDLYAAFQEQVTPAFVEVNERVTDTTYSESLMEAQTAALNSVWQSYSPTVSAATAETERYKAALEPTTGATSDLKFAMSELTTELIFNQAAQGLDSEAALALAVSMGLVDEKTLAVKNQLDAAREKYDENRDGLISATEAANGYADAILRITGQLQAAALAQQQMNAMANAMPGGAGGGVVAGSGGGYSLGTNGWETVPPGFPNDTYPIRMSSGEKFAVIPNGQTVNNFNMSVYTPAPFNVGAEFGRQRALAGAY